MPNANDFSPFGIGAGANVESPAAWAAETSRQTGFQAGTAQSRLFNTAIRQASVIATMIAKFTADYGPSNVNDDGNIAALETQFGAALLQYVAALLPSGHSLIHFGVDSGAVNALAATVTPTITARQAGDTYVIKTTTANTGACTFNPSGLGAGPIHRNAAAALVAGDIVANGYIILVDDGVNYNIAGLVQSDVSGNISNYVTNNYAKGSLIARRVFLASTTYVPTVGTTKVRATVVGGGGAGGGAAAPSGSNFSAAGGGGAGGTGIADIPSGFSGQVITVGAAGAPVLGLSGGYGGDSNFMGVVGGGGVGGAVAPNTVTTASLQAGGNGGVGSGGNVTNANGGGGGAGSATASNNMVSGVGGYSSIGAGGGPKFSVSSVKDGDPAASYGAGGGGAVGVAGDTSARYGGSGGQGAVIIEEYA
jgi:hypothetical protein